MYALVLYEYVVPEDNPVLLYEVILGSVVFINLQEFVDEQSPDFLYISKPVPLLLLSVHVRFILLDDTAVAERFVGL